MIKPGFYITILLSLLVCKSQAQQNLVPNGSFEEYNWCPDNANGFYIEVAKYWSNPTLGTSDYFNSCSIEYDISIQRFLFSVPENYIGYQTARTGKGYGGFVYTQGNDPNIYWIDQTYSEYLQVELNQDLISGKFYRLQFYISNPDEARCGNSVGALFLKNEMNDLHDKIILQQPQIQSDLSVSFCDSTKWFEINQIFQASGGERFLIIGVFTPLYQIQMSDYFGNVISGPGQFGANQYSYIDDISLEETNIELPNIFTPNNDGINDFCSFDILKSSANGIRIFNRWGETVYSSDSIFQWDGKLSNGSECSEGVYYFKIKTSNQDISGFIQLVR